MVTAIKGKVLWVYWFSLHLYPPPSLPFSFFNIPTTPQHFYLPFPVLSFVHIILVLYYACKLLCYIHVHVLWFVCFKYMLQYFFSYSLLTVSVLLPLYNNPCNANALTFDIIKKTSVGNFLSGPQEGISQRHRHYLWISWRQHVGLVLECSGHLWTIDNNRHDFTGTSSLPLRFIWCIEGRYSWFYLAILLSSTMNYVILGVDFTFEELKNVVYLQKILWKSNNLYMKNTRKRGEKPCC